MNREEPSAAVPRSIRSGDKQAEEDLWQCHKAERGVWTKPMLVALARGLKGNKWFSLIDKISTDRTLQLAWEKVRRNAGSCGVDGITIGRFEQDSQSRLLAVKEHLSKGTYQPKPVKRVWIDKPGSAEKRPLGIPTIADRVVQAAIRMVIEPIFDGRVLGLIEGFLKQGVMEDAELAKVEEETPEDEPQGTPQGGVISPLLANIYLDPLDWLMAGLGYEMVRYADDMVVLCQTEEEAKAALEKLRDWMAGAGLTLHPDKTRTVDMNLADSHFDFLGYRFKRSRRGKMMRLVRPKSLRKLRETIKPRTRRNNGKSMEA